MEALIDFLRNFVNDEATLRQTVVVVVAATIFVFGLGISIIVSAVTSPVRRRLGLIKQVAQEISREHPRLQTFVTLSW